MTSRSYSNGYCEYPPAPPADPGHMPAWKTIPPSRRWDAYRQIAESLPVIAETRSTLATAEAVAAAEIDIERRHQEYLARLTRPQRVRRWMWLNQEGLWLLGVLAAICVVLAWTAM